MVESEFRCRGCDWVFSRDRRWDRRLVHVIHCPSTDLTLWFLETDLFWDKPEFRIAWYASLCQHYWSLATLRQSASQTYYLYRIFYKHPGVAQKPSQYRHEGGPVLPRALRRFAVGCDCE